MRIPVKETYNGYTPFLDTASEEKLIWIKDKRRINFKSDMARGVVLGMLIWPVFVVILSIAGNKFTEYIVSNSKYSEFYIEFNEINLYQELGRDKFLLFYIIAIDIGFVLFIAMMIFSSYSSKRREAKNVTLHQSIEMYKLAPKHTQDDKEFAEYMENNRKDLWWVIPASILLFGVAPTWILTNETEIYSSEGSIGIFFLMILFVVTVVTVALLIMITRFFARKYLERKLGIKK